MQGCSAEFSILPALWQSQLFSGIVLFLLSFLAFVFPLQTSTPGGSIFLMATEKAASLKTYLHEHPPSYGSFFLYQNDKMVFSPLRLKATLKVFCLLWAVL